MPSSPFAAATWRAWRSCPYLAPASSAICARSAGAGTRSAALVEHVGALDVLLNAVGVVAFGAVSEMSASVVQHLLLANAMIPMMLASEALAVIPAGGAIVNISGVIAERNLPGISAYGASKAAVRAFDEALFGRRAIAECV